jgi:ribonuclease HI
MSDEACWLAWCDGCARPNPGRIGLGALLRAPDGQEYRLSEPGPQHGCNNEAEALALLATLQRAHALGATCLRVACDSDVVVRLARDASVMEAVRLAPLLANIRHEMAKFAQLELKWIPQHRNTLADELARAALGLPPRAPARPRRKRHAR